MTVPENNNVARATARHNLIAGLVLAGFAAFMFRQSYTISLDFVDEEGIGPRFFPQAVCVVFGLIGLTLCGLALLGRAAPADATSFSARRFFSDAVPLFALGLGFIWAFKSFGYLTAVLALLYAGFVFFGVKGRRLFLMPPVVAVALYLIFFRLMRIYEPHATLFNPLSLLGLN